MSQSKIPTFDRIKAKARIQATGRSVADVARSIDLERQTVGHWLRGRGEPNMRQIYQLAQEIGCHWLELVDDQVVVLNDPAERQRVERIRAASPAVQAMIDALLASVIPPRK